MKTLSRTVVWYLALAAVLAAGLVGVLVLGPRFLSTTPDEPPQAEAAPPADVRKIQARLFYVNEPGTGLTSVEREVVYGEGIVEQAKRIIEAQIAPPEPPLVSAIPGGARLRAVFFTADGDMYLDFSGEMRSNHPGGSTNESLTVYSLVSALTTNLPAITGVQILIDGKEVDTLAGHLDLRRPIEQDLTWITD